MSTQGADWSELELELERLECGASHWLPAYGFQHPADLQERNMEFFATDGGSVTAQLFLETILEETSDDLRSESSCSGPAGWRDSDSDTASVIHVCAVGMAGDAVTGDGRREWSGSERELAVPCKRRRHNTDPGVHDDTDTDTDTDHEHRSSSLLQFESLEKQCEDVFRTTATDQPFPTPPSPSRASNFSFDSLEANKWRFGGSGSQDSLEDGDLSSGSRASSTDVISSDDDTVNRSFSSRSGNGSFRSSGIRSGRSFDSLVLCHSLEKSESTFLGGELSQSLNNTSLPPEDPEPAPTPRGIYKTVECLSEVTPHVACSRSSVLSHGKSESDKQTEESEDKAPENPTRGSERSAENLSEDSGFGEHLSSTNLSRGRSDEYPSYCSVKLADKADEGPGGWTERCDARTKYNRVNWQSAPNLARRPQCERRSSEPSLYSFSGSKSLVINYVNRQNEEEVEVIPETKPFSEIPLHPDKMASRFSSVASTPNLYSATEEFLASERKNNLRQYAESTASLSRVSVSRLSTTTGSSRGSRGSNIMITTSFVNLSASSSVKGVHFCPVVSEVSWRESSSSGSSEDERSSPEDAEDARAGSERSDTPPFDVLVERLRSSPGRASARSTGARHERDGSIERRRVIEELNILRLEREQAPPRRPSHVGPQHQHSQQQSVPSERPAMEDQRVKKKHGLGGFFQRFSFRRLSGRDKKKEKKKKTLVNSSTSTQNNGEKVRDHDEEDFKIIPLHAPGSVTSVSAERKPPPAPSVATPKPSTPAPANPPAHKPPPRPSPVMATATAARGLLETDIDSDIAPASKKTRSLLNLDDGRIALKPCPVQREDSRESDSRAKSMEFLLDKENQAAVKPPENELQKVGGGERVMSEAQLRVQRSLQKLNVPDWYRNSNLPAQGFLLKRNSDAGINSPQGTTGGWQGLNNKTTSLSSLGSGHTTTPRSPNSHALSPSPTSHVFSRWSTSRLSSGATSTSTSPCGSTRSSFNYRQPYLGWRSQERLSKPRTPAERLAAELHAHRKQESGPVANAPNLNEVRTSIKEVTSAIVHYVSGAKDSTDRLSPALNPRWDRDTSSSRSVSPRGSTGRLCWLESSFVGSRPLDVPETPASTTTNHDLYLDLNNSHPHAQANVALQKIFGAKEANEAQFGTLAGKWFQQAKTRFERRGKKRKTIDLVQEGTNPEEGANFDGGEVTCIIEQSSDMPSILPSSNSWCDSEALIGGMEKKVSHDYTLWASDLEKCTAGPREAARSRPSPTSTTMEDVLDSLLGLPPTSRSPSPSSPSLHLPSQPKQRRSCGDLHQESANKSGEGVEDSGRRRSEGLVASAPRARRVSFEVEGNGLVRCRYSKCGKTSQVNDARRTFKTCHNCAHVYCSRECRRAHWEKHRKTCLHSRVGALCRRVLSTVKEDSETLHHISLLARRGFLARGRGAVKSFFSSPELAEKFVTNGLTEMGEPTYIRWADLLPNEMGPELYKELLRLCKSYNPDTRLVLYVAVCVVSEVPTSGAVKWERQMVSRCAKLKLSKLLVSLKQPIANITRDSEDPETLILTSLPGVSQGSQRARQISFTNIQRHLRQRGVSLRKQFPEVYQRLCAYVEGTSERFTPVTIYPKDSSSGKSFMCIIMPDAEPEKLELLPTDSTRVQTIDISQETQPSS